MSSRSFAVMECRTRVRGVRSWEQLRLQRIGVALPRLISPTPRRVIRAPRAEPTNTDFKAPDDCTYNIGEYCSIDDDGARITSRSIGEMEQDFLEAMQAWYFEGQSIMTDEEFENLKDELTWQGSDVVMLSSAEQKFLEASMGYANGKPLMSDAEYDKLKQTLKRQGSSITLAGPRCSLRSRAMYSDLQVDYLRMTALNVPAVTLVLSVLFFFDDITGFEISKLIELPEPWGILFLWGLGECPNCGAENRRYFGSIFVVESSGETAQAKCPECDTLLEFRMNDREIVALPPKAA